MSNVNLTKMRPLLKNFLFLAGGGLGFFGVVFVGLQLFKYSEQIQFSNFDVFEWSVILVLSIVYGMSNIMLALAWRCLLSFLGVKTSRSWVLKCYGVSQLAKYVPGNIFHFVGRQAIGLAEDLPGWILAKSAFLEIMLLIFSGALFAVLILPLLWSTTSIVITLIGFVCTLSLAIAFLRYWFASFLARALCWQIMFLILSSVNFFCILVLVSPQSIDISTVSSICGAYVIAWLAGLITPGAPAGVGVREFVILFLLGGIFSKVDLLLAVILGRAVTVGGDLGFFVVTTFVGFISPKSGRHRIP